MPCIEFGYTIKSEILPALQSCSVATIGQRTHDHSPPLIELSRKLKSTAMARRNMLYAGNGFSDLVILLCSPGSREEFTPLEEIMEDESVPCTMRTLDKSLRFAFCGRRDLETTVVLHARPFRGKRVRDSESDEERKKNDRRAVEALLKALDILKPRVVVVCNLETETVSRGLPQELCSTARDAGKVELLRLRNGHECLKVSSLHPLYGVATTILPHGRGLRMMRDFLFDASLIVAANALIGRTVIGSGISSLEESSRDSLPPPRPGVEPTSSEVMEHLRRRGAFDRPVDKTGIRALMRDYARVTLRVDGFQDRSGGGDNGCSINSIIKTAHEAADKMDAFKGQGFVIGSNDPKLDFSGTHQ
ncbi:hypothetical protein GQ602_006797 [Ophiocordyceps camponoti-floridani]|uniref:Uncharacterized protein n=1 Tax=Ophiocordyceps camponoti-floridani TaxID=2030778 RepID=A0A8H4Q1Z9_9HYPO|nr:hypothetical protein GQ602_006797 [Ophiocordyceps camponoti-floridani]